MVLVVLITCHSWHCCCECHQHHGCHHLIHSLHNFLSYNLSKTFSSESRCKDKAKVWDMKMNFPILQGENP
jgi:hypothetical protein